MECDKENYTNLPNNLPSKKYHPKLKVNTYICFMGLSKLPIMHFSDLFLCLQLNAGYLNSKKYIPAFISKVIVNIHMTVDILKGKDINTLTWMSIIITIF